MSPADNTPIGTGCQQWTFSWSGPTLTGPNEWYVIEKTKTDHPNEWGGMAEWTKGFSVTMNMARGGRPCWAEWLDNYGTYFWSVKIISGDISTHRVTGDLSPRSAPRTISYGH